MFEHLYCCKNCVHDAGQSLHVWRGKGFCVKHASVLRAPSDTTCKYHHRKDLPNFVVDEGRSEHAAEFAAFPALVSLHDKQHQAQTKYSERHVWERKQFDPIAHALAQYRKVGKSWVLVQSFAGSVDGRRALVHGCLVRRYMDQCGRWESSYRLVLALVQDLMTEWCFDAKVLNRTDGDDDESAREEAKWDVFFAQLSGLQEYGWHAGLEELMWASDSINGGLSRLDWSILTQDLEQACPKWTNLVIEHAKKNDEYFVQPSENESEEEVF